MRLISKTMYLVVICLISSFSKAQMPRPALVGYLEGWNAMKIPQIHENYNVIQLAFATTVGNSLFNMEYNLPSGYGNNRTLFLSDIDAAHAKGKVFILSIGGASDPVRLDNLSAKNTFVNSINKILSDNNYKIDGIDLDFEKESYNFGAWTMSSPAVGQTNMINAVKEIMANYKTQTGKKLLLTMAPETVYVQGAMSTWQTQNANGGAFLPILDALRDELDLIHCQLYNANESVAIDGKVYKDGTPDYITSMVDAIIVGFPLKENKGSFTGIPSSKIVLGLPASYNGCIPGIGVGSGFVKYVDIEKAVQYIKGEISKPSGWNYTLTKSYPDIAGLMTWSINKDETNCEGNWMFSKTFLRAFPEVITSTSTYHSDSQFEVYPNPTTGLINVSNASNYGESIKIINSLGELMLETNSQDTEELSLEKLQPGIYFIKIGSQVERLILN